MNIELDQIENWTKLKIEQNWKWDKIENWRKLAIFRASNSKITQKNCFWKSRIYFLILEVRVAQFFQCQYIFKFLSQNNLHDLKALVTRPILIFSLRSNIRSKELFASYSLTEVLYGIMEPSGKPLFSTLLRKANFGILVKLKEKIQ